MSQDYLYKITNILNGKIYYGVHSHNNPHNNSYMGGGTLLKYDQEKYGIENFRKEVVQLFKSTKEKLEAEAKIVDREFVARDDNYNCSLGGANSRDTRFASQNKLDLLYKIDQLEQQKYETRTPEQIMEAKRRLVEMI